MRILFPQIMRPIQAHPVCGSLFFSGHSALSKATSSEDVTDMLETELHNPVQVGFGERGIEGLIREFCPGVTTDVLSWFCWHG